MNSEEKQKNTKRRISEMIPLMITIYGIGGTLYFVFYSRMEMTVFGNTLLIASITMAGVGLFYGNE